MPATTRRRVSKVIVDAINGKSTIPVTLTGKDINDYVQGLANSSTPAGGAAKNPYTVYPHGTSRPGYSVPESQLNQAMVALGVTPANLRRIDTGQGLHQGSWLTDALNGLAGGLAGMPDLTGAGDVLDLIPGVSRAGTAIEAAPAATTDATTAADATAAGAAGGATSGAANTLAKQLTKDATGGAVLGSLVSTGKLKESAIWVGLMILGIALILMGLGRQGAKLPPILVKA
jgi:hypothetical protein